MYVRTPRASAWLEADDSVEALNEGSKPGRSDQSKPKPTTIEARKAFNGRLGRYIALRRIPPPRPGGRELLLVAVANKSPSERGPWWVKAESALNEREAAQWARDGF